MSDSLDLERVVRGSTAGFLIPNFVLDVPGEGGKRLTRSVEKYDRRLGVSTLTAPGRDGRDVEVLYWDPLWSVSAEAREEILSGKAIKGMGRYGITFREQGVVRGS